jgi:putative two-component system response regulator
MDSIMTKKEHQYTILIIDDEAVIRETFRNYLEDYGYRIFTGENGETGIQLLEREIPDIVLTDLRMPGIDGLAVLRHCAERFPDLPVIVVSGTGRIQDVVEALHEGAWDYLLKPIDNMDVLLHIIRKATSRLEMLWENKRYQLHLEAEVARRTHELERSNHELEMSRKQVIRILSQAAEYRDFETGNHFMRVGSICACLARGMGWSAEEIACLELASPVHDIGKIGIPDHILLKQGPLEKNEWEEMKRHCEYGNAILMGKTIPDFFLSDTVGKVTEQYGCSMLAHAANIALYHHERWDGTGYPSGLAGESIPVQARITAVADVYDAISSKRPYKEPWTEEVSLEYMRKQSGSQFDPAIIDVFFANIDTIRRIKEQYRDA